MLCVSAPRHSPVEPNRIRGDRERRSGQRGWGGLRLKRRSDMRRPSRSWPAVLAACCLIFQALASGLALGACASPGPSEGPVGAVHAVEPSTETPSDPRDHEHRRAPDCCFIACHLLVGKIAPSASPIVLAATAATAAGLFAPERGGHVDPGDERLPQNPRAPPRPA